MIQQVAADETGASCEEVLSGFMFRCHFLVCSPATCALVTCNFNPGGNFRPARRASERLLDITAGRASSLRQLYKLSFSGRLVYGVGQTQSFQTITPAAQRLVAVPGRGPQNLPPPPPPPLFPPPPPPPPLG